MIKEFLKKLFGGKAPQVVNETPVQEEPKAEENTCNCNGKCTCKEEQTEEAPKKKRRGRPRKKKPIKTAE